MEAVRAIILRDDIKIMILLWLKEGYSLLFLAILPNCFGLFNLD